MNDKRYQTRRHVVHPDATWQDVGRFARAFNWPQVEMIYRDRDARVDGQVIWQGADVAALHYIEDAISGVGYYVLTGENERTVEALAEVAAEMLQPWTLEELYRVFDESPDAQGSAKRALEIGLAAPPEFTDGVFSRIKAVISDEEPRARYAGLWAATYTGYREFIPIIREVAEQDAEDWVRQHAAGVLEAFAPTELG